MQEEYKNKKFTGDSPVTKKKTQTQYHFSGGGEYKPQVVEASSMEEAQKKYEDSKVKINK